MKRIITIVALLVLITGNIEAQDISTRKIPSGEYVEYIPSVFPPSPSAFKFSTYGNIPLNGSTGGFSYSIPLYTIAQHDISLPITLDYYSNGVKIDELAGIVGTDWNLNAGGVISRVVRGYPDENGQRWYPEYMNPSTDEIKKKIYAIANGQSTIDVERDWFSFNVNGISGSFYLDDNLNVIVNSKEYVKISLKMGQGGTYGTVSSFTLIDKKGYTYIFGGSEDYLEGTIASSTSNVGPKEKCYSSWFLKEIISPNHNKISFIYQNNLMSYNTGTSFSLTYDQNCNCDGIVSESYKSIYSPNVSFSNMKSRVISEIQFANSSIVFNYNTQRLDGGGVSLKDVNIKSGNDIIRKILFNYDMVYTNGVHPYEKLKTDNSLKYRLFLQDIIFTNKDETLKEKYSFEYFEKAKLPIRLSFSKDKYGYNNGSSNSSAFSSSLQQDPTVYSLMYYNSGMSYATANLEVNPSVVYYGMLKKIQYPTGGYTEINYEGNSNIVMGSSLKYTNQFAEIMTNCSAGSVNSATLTFTSNGTPLHIAGGASLQEVPGCAAPSPDPLHDKYSLVLRDVTKGTIAFSLNKKYTDSGINTDKNFAPVSNGTNYDGKAPFNTIEGHEYEITLKILAKKFNPSTGLLSISYNAIAVPVENTIYAGGARVKNIVDYDNGGKAYNKRRFYYNGLDQYPSSKSTLNDVLRPQYYNRISYMKDCISSCNKSDPSEEYKRITIYSSSNSSLYNDRKQSSYYTNITEFIEKDGMNNGAIERNFYEIAGNESNTITGPNIPGIPYSNESDGYYGLLVKEQVYKSELEKYILVNATQYKYLSSPMKSLSSHVIRKNYEGITNTPQAGEYGTNIDNISISLYYNYIGTPLINQISESTFLSGGEVISQTSYEYGDSPYYNLKNKSVSSSKESLLKTKYLYAPDLVGQLASMDKLTEANRVGMPIISETLQKNSSGIEKQIAYTKTTFAQFSVLNSKGVVEQLILPEFVYSPTADDKRITYKKYDEYGNIIHYALNDASNVSYLWGYNGQYPIAEIKNATYDQVSAALGVSSESLSSASEPNFSRLAAMRNSSHLSSALITTYKYEPLVGMTEATDPRGVTTYYSYDNFGRLKETYIIENNVKKVIQANEYHYQNQ